MLIRFYIEALLADELAADQVWELWNAGWIDDTTAAIAWLMLSGLQGVVDEQKPTVKSLRLLREVA